MNKPLTLTLTLTALTALGLSSPLLAQTAPQTAPPASPAAAPVHVQPAPLPAVPAPPQPAPAAPTSPDAAQLWTRASLQGATYLVVSPTLDGNLGMLNPDQQKSVLAAMQTDLQGAILRKYPTARFVTDPAIPGVISLHPVLTVPSSFFGSFQARLELSQTGSNAVVTENFGVLEVYQHQADAANFVFDRLAKKLP